MIDSISEEIENKTLDTLLSAPVSINWVTGAKIIASVVVGVLQCVLWVVLLGFNGFAIQNVGMILLLSMMVTGIIAMIALMVSLVFRDRERSQFIYSLVILVMFSFAYFVSPSPFALVARLATGDPFVGAMQLIVYLAALVVLAAITPIVPASSLPASGSSDPHEFRKFQAPNTKFQTMEENTKYTRDEIPWKQYPNP